MQVAQICFSRSAASPQMRVFSSAGRRTRSMRRPHLLGRGQLRKGVVGVRARRAVRKRRQHQQQEDLRVARSHLSFAWELRPSHQIRRAGTWLTAGSADRRLCGPRLCCRGVRELSNSASRNGGDSDRANDQGRTADRKIGGLRYLLRRCEMRTALPKGIRYASRLL